MPKKTKKEQPTELVVYQTKDGAIQLRGDVKYETLWATQAEIARIFGVTPQNVTIHLSNIYKQRELDKGATCKESLQVQMEGGRSIRRRVTAVTLIKT